MDRADVSKCRKLQHIDITSSSSNVRFRCQCEDCHRSRNTWGPWWFRIDEWHHRVGCHLPRPFSTFWYRLWRPYCEWVDRQWWPKEEPT